VPSPQSLAESSPPPVPPARHPDRGAPEDNSDCIRFGGVAFAGSTLARDERPHQLAKNPNIRQISLSAPCAIAAKPAHLRHSRDLARPMQSSLHRRIARRTDQWGNEMTAFSNYSQRIVASFAALAISAVLFANTLATGAAQVHSVAGILA
jgi:hypothetical protein